MAQQPNLFLLAADNSPTLLALLRANPTLATSQDEHGYSLLHAAASYNHLTLLKTLVEEFNAPVNSLRDEDGETCLFAVETVEAAKCLVEQLNVDPNTRNTEGFTAAEKLEEDGEFPSVVVYLKQVMANGPATGSASADSLPSGSSSDVTIPPPLPANVLIDVSTMPDPAADDESNSQQPDPEFRRRIEKLAAQENFSSEEGQKELKEIVGDAVRGVSRRDIRRRLS